MHSLVVCVVVSAADILKANDEVIRVMALYEDTVYSPDVDSLLIDHAGEDGGHGMCVLRTPGRLID